MGTGAIVGSIDVAQLVLYAFWIFFAGLIYYLIRENHREGYPMRSDANPDAVITGWPVPPPKTYKMAHGEDITVPDLRRDQGPVQAEPFHGWIGAPLEPVGDDPLSAGVGPGAWSERADVPDLTFEGRPKIVPIRTLPDHDVAAQDLDPRGLEVIGADDIIAGTCVDVWLDQSEMLVRYLEVELEDDQRRVLLPLNFARITKHGVRVRSIMGGQFAGVPVTRNAAEVTMLEEEKIMAYYGAGTLYADPRRLEPLF